MGPLHCPFIDLPPTSSLPFLDLPARNNIYNRPQVRLRVDIQTVAAAVKAICWGLTGVATSEHKGAIKIRSLSTSDTSSIKIDAELSGSKAVEVFGGGVDEHSLDDQRNKELPRQAGALHFRMRFGRRRVLHPELKRNTPASMFCMSWCADFESWGR